MRHGYFRDVFCKACSQRGNKGRFFVAFDHGIHDMSAIGPQHAAVIVHRHTDYQRGNLVMKSRSPSPVEFVMSLGTPSANDVVALVDSFEQTRYFFWRILQVRVQRITISPLLSLKPANIAECWPKLRASSTTLTRGSRRASSRRKFNEPSVEPSSTNITSQSRSSFRKTALNRSHSAGRLTASL